MKSHKGFKIIMMMSWRNLWRHKRRSMVVITSMAIGVFAVIATAGLMNGFNTQMVENNISTSLGHIAIHAKGFQDNMKLKNNFRPYETLYKIIKNNKSIVSYTPRVKLQGMVRSAEASRQVFIVGIDPEKEKKVSKIFDYTLTGEEGEGGSFLTDPNEDTILISKTLADNMELMVGDKLVLMVQDMNNEIVGVGLRVNGIYRTPIDTFDKIAVFIGINKFQEILKIGENISEINIITKNKNYVDATKKYLIEKISNPNLEILSWKDMAPSLVSAIELFDRMIIVFYLIILITVVFSIANTLIMAIMERFHEIGVMKSIGTRPSKIFFMILFEAFSLGFVGLAFGLSVGVALVTVLSFTGIDFSFYMESMRSLGTGSIIYPSIRIMDILKAFLVVFCITFVGALYPAIKAARIKPLEALHYI